MRKIGPLKLWLLWVAFILLLVVVGPPLLTYMATRPEPSMDKGLEITGVFQGIEYAGGTYGPGIDEEEHNRWRYQLVVDQAEFNRLSAIGEYIAWDDGDRLTASLESTGNWCGEVPPVGTLVKVKNPTGFTRRVTIADLETGRVYRSEGRCLRPTFIYNVRITYAGSGELLFQDKVEAHDVFDLLDIYAGYFEDSQYEVRYWKEGEPAP